MSSTGSWPGGRLTGVPTAAIMAAEVVSLGSLTVPTMLALAMRVRAIDMGMEQEDTLAVVAARDAVWRPAGSGHDG